MNPWALVILGIGVLLIIMGVKGSYGGVIGALTGKPYTGTGSAGAGSGGKKSTMPQGPMGSPSSRLTGPVRPGMA
jgi:hypothetical protein